MVPLTMPRRARTRLAPRSQTSGPRTGTPPATAASKRRPTPAARAAASRSRPCLASSSLLALTTRLPASKARRMARRRDVRAAHELDDDVDVVRGRHRVDVVGQPHLGGQRDRARALQVADGDGDERGTHMAAGHGVGAPVGVEQPGGHGGADGAEAEQPDALAPGRGAIGEARIRESRDPPPDRSAALRSDGPSSRRCCSPGRVSRPASGSCPPRVGRAARLPTDDRPRSRRPDRGPRRPGSRLLRRPALGPAARRQPPRRLQQLHRHAGRPRGHLLHRRLPRPDEHARRRAHPAQHARDGARPAGPRPRPRSGPSSSASRTGPSTSS